MTTETTTAVLETITANIEAGNKTNVVSHEDGEDYGWVVELNEETEMVLVSWESGVRVWVPVENIEIEEGAP